MQQLTLFGEPTRPQEPPQRPRDNRPTPEPMTPDQWKPIKIRTCPECKEHIGDGETYCCECGRLNDVC